MGMTNLIVTVGYPGAGKSEVTNVAENLGIKTVSMGDRIRSRFHDAFDTLDDARNELSMDADGVSESEIIGEWASLQREMYGDDIVAKWTVEHIHSTIDSDNVVVDGMRSPEELGIFHKNFDDVVVLYISCPSDVRYSRLKDRGRNGEGNLTNEKLRERDKREDEWGVDIVINRADVEINNNCPLNEFQNKVSSVLRAYQFSGRGGLNRF